MKVSPNQKPLTQWSEEDIVDWLHNKGGILTKFVRAFSEFHVDGKLLDTISERDLNSMGITNQMEVKSILRARDKLIKQQAGLSEKSSLIVSSKSINYVSLDDQIKHAQALGGDYLQIPEYGIFKVPVEGYDFQSNPYESSHFGLIAHYMGYSSAISAFFLGMSAMQLGTFHERSRWNGYDIFVGVYTFLISFPMAYLENRYGRERIITSMPNRAILYLTFSILCYSDVATLLTAFLMLMTSISNFLSWMRGEQYDEKKAAFYGDYDLKSYIEMRLLHAMKTNQFRKYIAASVYILINFIILVERWAHYEKIANDSDGTLSKWYGPAKGFGTVLDLNCSIILLPVCRTFIRWLYWLSTSSQVWWAHALSCIFSFFPLDKAIDFHKFFAIFIGVAGWWHTWAHYMNFAVVPQTYDDKYGSGIWVTGISLILICHIMFCTAFDVIRKRKFEMFWFSHQMYILFYIFLLIHGHGMWNPNFWKYFLIPGVLYGIEKILRYNRSNQQIGIVSVTHMGDNLLILELEKVGSLSHFREGQYCFLKCKHLSQHQWHPFTISSAPQQDTVSFHIRVMKEGSWTYRLQSYLKAMGPPNSSHYTLSHREVSSQTPQYIGPDGLPLVCIDGPYSAPTEHLSSYEVVVVIGAGIGVTPLRAALQSTIHYRFRHDVGQLYPAYTSFHWICRWKELSLFQFMMRTLKEAEDDYVNLQKINSGNLNRSYEVHIWVTSVPGTIPPFTPPNVEDDLATFGPSHESIRGDSNLRRGSCGFSENDILRCCWKGQEDQIGNIHIHPVRPGFDEWNQVFSKVQRDYPMAIDAGVLVCGPKQIGKTLQHVLANETGPLHWNLHTENF